MLSLYFFRCKNYYKNNVRNYVILLYIMHAFVLSWKKKQQKNKALQKPFFLDTVQPFPGCRDPSSLLTTRSQVSGAQLIDFGSMKDWVDLELPSAFEPRPLLHDMSLYVQFYHLLNKSDIHANYIQVRNQEFFRAAEVSWNKGISINISSTTHKMKVSQGKILEFSLLDALKSAFRLENFKPWKHKI